MKRMAKLLRPKSKSCVYEILKKAISQNKVTNRERFRWIRRVGFILDEISGVYVYDEEEKDSGMEIGEEITHSEFQDILLFINEKVEEGAKTDDAFKSVGCETDLANNEAEDVSIIPKLISYSSVESIDDYHDFKRNIKRLRQSSVSYHLEEDEFEKDHDETFDAVDGDIELLLTKYFQNVEL